MLSVSNMIVFTPKKVINNSTPVRLGPFTVPFFWWKFFQLFEQTFIVIIILSINGERSGVPIQQYRPSARISRPIMWNGPHWLSHDLIGFCMVHNTSFFLSNLCDVCVYLTASRFFRLEFLSKIFQLRYLTSSDVKF